MSHFDGGHKSKNFVLPFICAFLLVNTAAFPQNFWQQTNGPLGGDVRALVVKSTGDVFAGHNESGIYRSSDNGTSWTAVNNGLANGAVNALAINSSGDLFAGTFGGVFHSNDNGATWTAVNTNLTNTRVRGLAINSADSILAATEGGVFISKDNGKTWRPVNSGLTNLFVQALMINNTTGDIFAGTTTGFFLSSNNGGAWRAFNPGLSPSLPSIRALAINGQGHVFAGTNNGVYRLLSTTASWTPINTGLTNFFIPSIYVHSNGEIFAGSEGSGIFRSSDNGNNWSTANVGLGVMVVQAFARNASGNIFAGTTGGVFHSAIGGASLSWTEVNNGMLTAKVSALAIDESTSYIFAGTTAGRVFRTKDEGTSWTLVSTGLPNDAVQSINALAINPASGDLFAGTGNAGMYRSSNDGNTWTRINLGLAESNILSLAINASGDIFAGGASDGVARSTDNGASWQEVNAGLTNTTIRALAINASGDIFAGTSNGIFYSKDNGNNWTAVNSGLPARPAIFALAVDTNNDVYAALANGTVYRLPDTGDNWVPANSGLPGALVNALTANAAGHVFAGTSLNGAYRTIDNGAKWSAINSGLTSNLIESFAIRVAGFAFAGTGAAGVFRSVKSTAPPAVTFSTGNLNYGNVLLNSSAELTVTLTNTGFADLSIIGTAIAGASATEFSLVSGAGTLAPNASQNIVLRFSPLSVGNKTASFVLTSNAESTPDTVILNGAGVEPLVSFVSSNLNYGNVSVNAEADLAVRLINTGTADLLISNASLVGPNADQFNLVNIVGSGTLAPSAFLDVTLRFSPRSAGNKLGYFVIASNAASTPDTVTLNGTGIAPLVSFSTDSLKYGNVLLNAISDLTVRLTNTGTAALSISSTNLAGANASQFRIVSGGGAGTLLPNAFRDITLRFTPASVGNKAAYFVLGSNVVGLPDTVKLIGTGITPLVSFSTDSLKFGNVLVNSNSDLTVRLTNTGTAVLSISSTNLAGANASQFRIVSGGGAGTLLPNAFRDITLRFTPTSVGNKAAYFVLGSNVVSLPDTVKLIGTGITPLVSFSTDSLKFGNVLVNSNSDLTVRLTNTGTAALSISSTALAGASATEFSIVSGGGAGTLLPNAFRDITLRFTPASVGNKAAYFVLGSNVVSLPDTVKLIGTGITPLVSFSTDSLKYGKVLVNAISDLTVRLTNTGTAALSISSTVLAGASATEFSIVSGGGAGTLLPNAFRDITLRFAPTSVGNKAAYFVLGSNVISLPDTVKLIGTGITPLVSFSTDSLKYGNVLVNASSNLTVRLTNTGIVDLTINSMSVAGVNSNQFDVVSGGDAGTLAPNAFRDIAVRFTPTSVGNKTAYFVLNSNASSTPDTVTLIGNGVRPVVSFAIDSLKYGNVLVNASSNLTVRLTNTGIVDLTINSTSVAGVNSNQFNVASGGDAGTLAPNAFRDITVRFTPASVGNKVAYFVLNSNASSTPDTVTLTGTGITSLVTFSTDSLKYGNVVVNTNSDLTVRLTNTGIVDLTINSTSVAGVNSNQFDVVSGGDAGTLAPNAFRDITVRFTPASVGNKVAYFVLNSNASSTPDTVTLTGTGITSFVTFSTDSLKYGNVLVNANSDLTVRLTNTGTSDLSISNTSLAGANANQFSIGAGGGAGTLAPNAFRDITLRFAPTSAGDKISYFVLVSNAASSPDTVTLIGTGAQAILSLSSDSLQYGSWVVNSSSEQTLRLANTGTTELAIVSTTLAGLNTADFSIVNGGGAGILLPNTFREVLLRFTPQSRGNKLAQLVITSNAASSPDTVTLLGNGVDSVVEQDSLALVALFNSTNGPNWKNKTNWLQGPVSSWFGVIIFNNAVTAVKLDSNNLAGPLPAQIGNLTQLTSLDLGGNQLTGAIPGTIGNLRNLAYLNLSGNQLFGDMPNQMTNLNTLRELYLHDNRLVNLPNVTTIAALDTLFIHGNLFTFEDIEPNLATRIDSILYAPQDSVGSPNDTTLSGGAKLTLRVNVGGNNNQYQWLKDGAPIAGANSNTFTILVATSNDVGAYVCRITNTVATQLTLFSRPQRISAVIAPRFTFAPKTLNFGSVRVNASFDQTVTLTNTLNVDIAIQQTAIIAANAQEFSIVNGGAQILPANSSRTITVRFIPKTRGSKFAALQIISNAAATLDTVNLAGAGVEPLTTLSNSNLNFGAVALGANSNQTVTLTNSGTANLTINFVDIAGVNAGDFSITAGGTTGALAPNASRNIALRFAPQASGAKTALLVITTDAASSPDTVTLSGTGSSPALSLSRRNVDFGNVWVGGTPVAQTVTLINTSAANLNITGVNLSGANEFLITSGGPATIAPSAAHDIVLQFSPQTIGAKNAALIISSNAASLPDTVKLSGSGSELTVNVGNSGNPLVGTSVNLAVSSLGGFVPTSRFLFFRPAGETKYDSISVAPSSSGFTADIPPEAVTLRGVEYYVRFSDGSTVVTYPPFNARNKPQMIRVRIAEHPFPLALEPNTYKMISVGMDLDSTGFAHVLEEYAEYDTLFWRLFRWENNRYEEYSDINAKFTPGTAFWLITRAGDGFGFNEALSTPSVQPFTVTLQPGWNQIANPFAFPVAVDSLRFTGRADTLAFWDGVEYQYNVTVLEPWEGYFINNLESTPITLTIPPVAAAKKSGKAATARALAANEYMLQLSAQMLGTKIVDTQNFAGLLNRAQVDRDALDFAEAPALGDYVQLSIVENNERFAGNFKPANGDGQQWAFEVRAHVRANVAKKLQISLQETGQLPEGFQRFVLDQDYGAILPLSNETFRVDLSDKFSVRHFKIIVGTKAYAESNNDGIPLAPVDYVLEQNYPNPFALSAQSGAGNLQTTIRYQLNKRAPVVLEIRNILGQKVRTLVDGEQNTGPHAATWDGLDEAGRAAASGVYFYTLKTAEFTATRKLVLTR